MFKTQETKAFGSIRKMKKYGACGVILGMAALAMAFSSGSVSADELSANQNVPKIVQEAPKQKETVEKNTTVDVVVDHSHVDNSVSVANKAGLTVHQDVPVDAGVANTPEELAERKSAIEKSYATQAEHLSEEASSYKKEVGERENERTVIKHENDAKKKKYNEELEQYKSDSEKANQQNTEIDRQNKKKNDDYDSQKKKTDEANNQIRSEHEKAVKELKAKNAEIDKKNQEAQTDYNKKYKLYSEKLKDYNEQKAALEKQGRAGSANGVTLYGDFDETARGSMKYYKNFTAVFDGVPNLELANDYLGYRPDTKITASRDDLLEDYSWNDTEGKFINKPRVGDSFTLHNIGETDTGKKISAKFTFKTVVPEWQKMGVDSVYSRLLVTHNKKSITNAIDFNVFNMQAVDTDIEYFEEGTGKPIKLGMVNTFSDVDYGQELRWEYEDGTTGVVMNPKGSDILEITRDGKNLFKGEHRWDVPMGYDDPSGLNEWKASDLYYKNVKDEDDVPLGSMLTVGSGSRMHLIYSKGNKSQATRSQDEWDIVRKNSDERTKAEGKAPLSDAELFMSDYAFQLWGRNASLTKPLRKPDMPNPPELLKHEKETIPDPTYLPSPTKNPDQPHVPTPPKPGEPDYTPIPNKIPSRIVHVRYANLKYKPSVNPTKSVEDTHGNNIDGAKTFDKNVKFKLKTDYAPYSKFTASPKSIAKLFALVDDVQDGAYTVDNAKIKATDDEGKDAKQLFDMFHVLSDKGRTDVVNEILKEAGLSPKGEFYMWIPKDNSAYYKNYVSKGKNVTFDLFAKLLVKEGQKVENDFHQIDFGIDNKSNLVMLEVPEIKPEKHALDHKDNSKVRDGQEIQIGEYLRYLLDGVTVPAKHDTLYQYDGIDMLDFKHDRYTGNWSGIIRGTEYLAEKDLVLPYDVVLSDGKVVKAGDKIAKGSAYAFQFEFNQSTNSDFIKKIVKVTWNEKDGKWAYTIDKEFLNSLGAQGTFDADFYVEVERIASGEVENKFVNIINSQEMDAKVTTHTPEPEKPQEPKNPELPNTGAAASSLGFVGTGILSMFGLFGLKRKKD